MLLTLSKEIGLTPASRQRMNNPQHDPPDDDLAELEAILS
jgi:phage terminase small subunit